MWAWVYTQGDERSGLSAREAARAARACPLGAAEWVGHWQASEPTVASECLAEVLGELPEPRAWTVVIGGWRDEVGEP